MRHLPSFALAACCAVLAGCTAGPAPLTEAAGRAQRQAEALERLRAQAPSQALDAADAGAIALRANLDLRMAALQRLLAESAVEAADLRKLPDLLLQAGYSRRSHLEAGEVTPLDRRTASEALNWDVMGFATASVRARAASDQTLLAALTQREEANRVLLETRQAWHAVAHQQAREPLLQQAQARIDHAMALLARLHKSTLVDPQLLALRETELWQMQARLRTARLEARTARLRLASLLAVADGERLQVRPPSGEDRAAEAAALQQLLQLPVQGVEEQALRRRTELARTDVQARILRHEAQLQWLALLPGLRVSASHLRDTDSPREPAWWTERGAALSLNLASWLNVWQQRRDLELRRGQLEVRQLVLAVGIVEQVRAGRERLDTSLAQWGDARTRLALAQVRADLWATRTAFQPDDEFTQASAAAALADARIQADAAWEAVLRAGWELMAASGLAFAPPAPAAGSPRPDGTALRQWWAALPAQLQEQAP